jgi:hypothetical protein
VPSNGDLYARSRDQGSSPPRHITSGWVTTRDADPVGCRTGRFDGMATTVSLDAVAGVLLGVYCTAQTSYNGTFEEYRSGSRGFSGNVLSARIPWPG